MGFRYLLEARRQANEASAVGTMKAIVAQEQNYHSSAGTYGSLASLLNNHMIDSDIAGAGKSGYIFAVNNPTSGGYFATATPQSALSGGSQFYTDESSLIFQAASSATVPAVDTMGSAPPGFSELGN